MQIEKPIFFIGVPRSGTTIIFEAFSIHEGLGWFSNVLNRFPGFPAVSVASRLANFNFLRGHKEQDYQNPRTLRYQVYPQETYSVWEKYARKDFSFDYLLNAEVDPLQKQRFHNLVKKVLTYQGKKRFANKLTGPSRIHYLNSLFPDAFFVHVIRDGRAVVNSLMNVPFWREQGGFVKPFWANGLPDHYLREWERYDCSPLVLAAVQWRNIIEVAREERIILPRNRYLEIKYEDFLINPYELMCKINNFCELPPSKEQDKYLLSKVELKDMNAKYLKAFKNDELLMLNEIVKDLLLDLGYSL